MLKRTAVAVLVPALLVTVASCSGDDAGSGDDSDALADRLTAARSVLDDASSLELDLKTDTLPSGVTGLLEAQGTGTHAPAFEGKVKVALKGVPVGAEVVSVDGTAHVKTGFAPKFVPMDPASIGAPDPAALMRKEDGISSLLSETDDLAEDGESRDGRDVLTTITGTIGGAVIQDLIPTAQTSEDFEATYRLTDDDVLRDVTLSGLFYDADESVTYTIALTASDESVTISAP